MNRFPLLLVTLFAFSSCADAAVRQYVRFGTALNNVRVKDIKDNRKILAKGTTAFDVAYGLFFTKSFRSDLEYAEILKLEKSVKIEDDLYKTTYSAKLLIINGYYNMQTGYRITPYIMVGFGISNGKIKQVDIDYNTGGIDLYKRASSGFAHQTGLGLTYLVNDVLSIDMGYKYIRYNSIKDKLQSMSIKLDSYSNVFQISGRYSF